MKSKRVYYDVTSGEWLMATGLQEQRENEIISYIDLLEGDTILEDAEVFHIENGEIIVDKYVLSTKEKLEDELLLEAGVV